MAAKRFAILINYGDCVLLWRLWSSDLYVLYKGYMINCVAMEMVTLFG